MEGQITEKQREYVLWLCRRKNVEVPENLDRFSKAAASGLIDNLKEDSPMATMSTLAR